MSWQFRVTDQIDGRFEVSDGMTCLRGGIPQGVGGIEGGMVSAAGNTLRVLVALGNGATAEVAPGTVADSLEFVGYV